MASAMNIRAALGGLVALESGLVITSPVAATIKKVYNYTPDLESDLGDTPAWINSWTMDPVDDVMTGAPLQHYTVHSQLLIFDRESLICKDFNRASDIATAFHVALVDAWHDNQTLGGTVSYCDLKGNTPTLGLLTWHFQVLIGLDLIFTLDLDN